MPFKSNDKAYTDRALRHLKQFIEENKLFTPDQNLLLAISGGIDSMVLGYLISCLIRFGYSNKLRFLYVNHNTRDEQVKEMELVKAYASHLGVRFHTKVLSGLNPNKNFEHEARRKRYQVMQQMLEEDELLLFAHHIDDSYEWSILQGLRSSNVDSMLGIPLVNGKIRRPLMCFSKQHIINIALKFDLPYMQDPTNEQIKYERNFLRHKIIKSFAARHPKYLLHYVNRHNELTRRLGVHRSLSGNGQFHVNRLNGALEVYSLTNKIDFSGLDSLIKNAVAELNPNGRGSLHGQLKKIKQAIKNNKYGPLVLSGGVRVYTDFNYLFICRKDYQLSSDFNVEDMQMNLAEYKTYLHQNNLPLLVELLDKDKNFVLAKRTHPLLEQLTDQLTLEKMRYLSSTQLLRQWSKDKNIHKTLKLRFFHRT
jgi:tRNA(Ile)-lysidine synthase